VGIRLSADELTAGGFQVQDIITVARTLEQRALIDFLDLSISSSFAYHRVIGGMDEEHGYQLPYSTKVARAVSVPSIVVGRIKTLDEAERIVAAGDAAMVAMVRAAIADPDLIAKSLAGKAHRV